MPDERAPHQCRGSGRADEPDLPQRPRRLAPDQMAALAALGGGRSRPGARRGGALAAEGFAAPHRGGVRRHPARVPRRPSNWRHSVFGGCPCARSTRSRTRRRRWRSNKLPRSGRGSDPGAGTRQAAGDLFQGKPDQKTVPRTVFPANARVGQQGTLTRIWARRGTRPRAMRDTRTQWAYSFGAVCPARGTAAGLVLPTVNTEAMSAHLAEISPAMSHPFVGEIIPRIMS